MAIFPLRGCVIPFWTTWDKRGYLGAHLYHKYPKLVKKWLSYGYFPIGRLGDSIENLMWQKGILWYSFVPKKIQNWSRNGWVMAFRSIQCLCLSSIWSRSSYKLHILYSVSTYWGMVSRGNPRGNVAMEMLKTPALFFKALLDIFSPTLSEV